MSNESAPQGHESPEVKYVVTQIDGRTPYAKTYRIEPPMPIGQLFLRGAVGDNAPQVLEAEFIARNAQGTYIAVATNTLALEAATRALDIVGKRIQVLANHPEKALDMSAAQLMPDGQFRSPF